MVKERFAVEFEDADAVYIAGDFNDWDPEARRMKRMSKDEALFVAVVDLEPGTYEFKYVVDGEWRCCPDSPRAPNDVGEENSVVEVTA